MKINSLRQFLAVTMAMLLVLCAVPTQAQAITATNATVALSYTQGESISVSASTGSLAFNNATTPQTPSFTITTTWNVNTVGRTRVDMNLGFTGTSAMASGSNTVSFANLQATKNGIGLSGCNASIGVTAATTTLLPNGQTCNVGFGTAFTTNFNSSQTDTYQLFIANASSLGAGTYSGTLTIVAAAI